MKLHGGYMTLHRGYMKLHEGYMTPHRGCIWEMTRSLKPLILKGFSGVNKNCKT